MRTLRRGPPNGHKLLSVEVELTVEDAQGATSRVKASGADYEEALAAAKTLIPDGSRMIVIRKYP